MQRTGKPRFFIRPGLVDMEALNKIDGEKMDQRFRRDRISDKRREKWSPQIFEDEHMFCVTVVHTEVPHTSPSGVQ
eukprot:g23143.t1